MNRINPMRLSGRAWTPLIVCLMIAASVPVVDAQSAPIPAPLGPITVSIDEAVGDAVADATKCAKAADYDARNSEWSQGFNDDGLANFWTGLGVPLLLGYAGDGGHAGAVLMCKTGSCSGGWLPVVGDFSWAGTSLLGLGAAITIHSAEEKAPIVYSTCAGHAADFLVAQSGASTIDGQYTASAIHGGIGVPASSGVATLQADGNMLGFYSYHWSYSGLGDPLSPVTRHVPCKFAPNVCNAIGPFLDVPVYGSGADSDIGT